MAIKKSKLLPNGVTGNYWKIVKEEYNRVAGKCVWTINLFLNEECGKANKDDLRQPKSFIFSVNKEEMREDRTALGYKKIKAKVAESLDPDLSDSEDV